MEAPFVIRFKVFIPALFVTGLLALGLSLSMPDSSEAQDYPMGPTERSAPMNESTPPTPPSPPGPPAQTPIDGGLGFLLAAGGAYALRKMHKNKQAE